MGTTVERLAVDVIAEGAPPVTAAGLVALLAELPPDMPVVLVDGGPCGAVASPLELVEVSAYVPVGPDHGMVREWENGDGQFESDAESPGTVARVVALYSRGVPDDV